MSCTDTSKHSIYLWIGTDEEVIILCACVTWHIHIHDNAACMAQHNAQYAKLWYVKVILLLLRYAPNNSYAYKITLANRIPTLICLYLSLWSEGSGERPKIQKTSIAKALLIPGCHKPSWKHLVITN